MNKNVKQYVQSIDRRSLTSNTARVLHTLLTTNAEDGWVSRNALRVNSAAARLRDLRKEQYGAFDVQCVPAAELGKRGDNHTFFYRIGDRDITVSQVRRVFEGQ